MRYISRSQVEQVISGYLQNEETLVSVGIFKQMPSITWLLLTKGMAWFLTRAFYVGVTSQGVIILPYTTRNEEKFEDAIFADYDDTQLYNGPFNNTVLEIQKMYKGEPLKLRFITGRFSQGFDLYEFIAALKQKMTS
jgi:hypothetical protein